MEIYTDIPAPHCRKMYEWNKLEIGNSTKFSEPNKFHTIRNSLYNYTQKSAGKFTTRIINGELWVWRVA